MSGPTSETVVATHTVRGREYEVTRLTWRDTNGLSFDVTDKVTGESLNDESFDTQPGPDEIAVLLDEDGTDVEITIEWSETTTYRSTVYFNREGFEEYRTNNAVERRAKPDQDWWAREYIDAGEESDWFDQTNPSDDLTAVTERTVMSAHIVQAGEPRA